MRINIRTFRTFVVLSFFQGEWAVPRNVRNVLQGPSGYQPHCWMNGLPCLNKVALSYCILKFLYIYIYIYINNIFILWCVWLIFRHVLGVKFDRWIICSILWKVSHKRSENKGICMATCCLTLFVFLVFSFEILKYHLYTCLYKY